MPGKLVLTYINWDGMIQPIFFKEEDFDDKGYDSRTEK